MPRPPETLALVVRPARPAGHPAFAARVAEALAPRVEGLREAAIADRPAPRVSLLPLAREPFALILAEAAPPPIDGLTVHAYRVRSSTPVEGPSAGPGMVTLFRRRPGLDREAFLARWHDGHSPLAIRVHPLVRYVRHVVEAPLGDAPPLDGIVLEQVARPEDLLRPWRFFGGPLRMLPNALRVAADARGFLDLKTIENQLVRVGGSISSTPPPDRAAY